MKDPWHLAPWDSFRAIVIMLGHGTTKREPRAWESGRSWAEEFSALQRHLTSWFSGEHRDPHSGRSHLWHAGARLVILIAMELRGIGTDDRPARVARRMP
jgi:hypothetical protein